MRLHISLSSLLLSHCCTREIRPQIPDSTNQQPPPHHQTMHLGHAPKGHWLALALLALALAPVLALFLTPTKPLLSFLSLSSISCSLYAHAYAINKQQTTNGVPDSPLVPG